MKTIIIWDQCGENPLSFFLVEGDLNHLNGTYLNSVDSDEDNEAQLLEITEGAPALDSFPTEEVLKGAQVIVCGFLP